MQAQGMTYEPELKGTVVNEIQIHVSILWYENHIVKKYQSNG
jgi:hypothetical protein